MAAQACGGLHRVSAREAGAAGLEAWVGSARRQVCVAAAEGGTMATRKKTPKRRERRPPAPPRPAAGRARTATPAAEPSPGAAACTADQLLIVGIGASAGGIDAVSLLL